MSGNKSPSNLWKCSVCARPARGFHCSVVTCKGCKTFFRRICVSDRHVSCFANDDCFDLEKRNQPMLRCRACRYKKCIEVGMNPLALELNENEAEAPNYRKLVKRTGSGQEEQRDVVRIVESAENKMQKLLDMLVYLELKLEAFRSSAHNPKWTDVGGVENILKNANTISIADRVGPMPGWPLKDECRIISMDFWTKQENCAVKYQADTKHWHFFDVLTTVEYAKTFPFFYRLDMSDRLILIRHVAVACMNLHVSYFAVSQKCDSRIQPDGVFCPVREGPMGNAWALSIGPFIRCQVSFHEYVLLKMICLCNPAVPELSEHAQTLISEERHLYADALFDHCRRSRADGVAHFAQLLGLLEVVERQQRLQKDINLVYIAPFMAKLPAELKISLLLDIFHQ